MDFNICGGITDIVHLNVSLVRTYAVRGYNSCPQLVAQASHSRPHPPPLLPWCQHPGALALNTGSLSVCIHLSLPSIQSCKSVLQHHSTTATFFSSCWSPSGPAPHRTGRRRPVHGSPSPSRHTGTTPYFSYKSHIQLCHLLLLLPPPGSWEKRREKRKWK